ncbi:MAG: DUF2279 domain-containing protein [Deltaproteobacteria bacterium]|nr:DUF2279 domain-containing protein [Deltaproteobacteria bacterium]
MTAVLLIAWLRLPAVAGPLPSAGSSYDPDATARSPATPESPWIDLAPSKVLAIRAEPAPTSRRKLAASLTLAGVYVGFMGWTYLAWYRVPTHPFAAGGDGNWKLWSEEGWFGKQRYAGGADKWGHAWATMGLARGGTELLYQAGGYSRLTSAIVGTTLSELLFLGVEIKDGFAYRFSYGDFAFNTLGAAWAFASSMSPQFDELFDFRVQYAPSARYREKFRDDGDLDIAEDYSGQTYLVSLHLGGIRALRDARWGGWSRFVDVSFGFESRGYKPDPPYKPTPEMPDYAKSQTTFIGLSLNAQGLFDYLLRGRSEPARKILHGTFEVWSLPYTTLPLASRSVAPIGDVPDEPNN